MRYLNLGLILLLLFLAYLTTRPFPHFSGQDPAVSEYVRDFKDLAQIHGYRLERDPSIGFEEIDKYVMARCYSTATYREIVIDSENWDQATMVTRRMLLYHELTHCYCGRGHVEELLADGCPSSVMTPKILLDNCSTSHFDYYVTEMFNGCRPFK